MNSTERLSASVKKARNELKKARNEVNRLQLLDDFFENWEGFIVNFLDDRLSELYGSEYKVEHLEVRPHAERFKIVFNFTGKDLDGVNRFEFSNDVIEPMLEEIRPNPHLKVFENTLWLFTMGDKKYITMNIRPNNYEEYEYMIERKN